MYTSTNSLRPLMLSIPRTAIKEGYYLINPKVHSFRSPTRYNQFSA